MSREVFGLLGLIALVFVSVGIMFGAFVLDRSSRAARVSVEKTFEVRWKELGVGYSR